MGGEGNFGECRWCNIRVFVPQQTLDYRCGNCWTVAGPSSGQLCVFPFSFQGELLHCVDTVLLYSCTGEVHHSCAEWRWGGDWAGQRWCRWSALLLTV